MYKIMVRNSEIVVAIIIHHIEENYMDLIKLTEVCKITGLKPSTIFKHIKTGKFLKPYKLLGRLNAWKRSEVIEWLESQR
jgi:predicted DNA-binding transcriptional regulator AlpA